MRPLDTLIAFGGALKVLETKGDLATIGGAAVLYDEPGGVGRDLTGDYFRKDSDLGHRRGDGVDCTFHHGFPIDAASPFAVGLAEHKFANPWRTEDTDRALVASIVLDMRSDYEAFVCEQVEAGALSLSSGAVGHKVKRDPDGWLKRWWIGEISPTPTPAEPRLGALSMKGLLGVKFAAAFLGADRLKGDLSLYAQLDRVEQAWYRSGSEGYVTETFADYVVASISGAFYRVPYVLADAGTVTFADRTEWLPVERVWQPVKSAGLAGDYDDIERTLKTINLRLRLQQTW